MKKIILTIAIILSAATAFADDHRGHKSRHDNGHHYGKQWKHASHRDHDCRTDREWRPVYGAYRPEYRKVRVVPPRYVSYEPEYIIEQPRVAIAVPAFPLSINVVFR